MSADGYLACCTVMPEEWSGDGGAGLEVSTKHGKPQNRDKGVRAPAGSDSISWRTDRSRRGHADGTTESAKDIGAKALLGNICGGGSTEPACNALADLRRRGVGCPEFRCRLPLWQTTAPCSTFRQQRGGVLIFNLKTNGWTAQWEQTSYPLTFDVTGVPTMRLRPGNAKPLKILVEEVSPLTYSAAPGVSKEEDLEIVANLKSFLALAGIGLQGLAQTLAFVVAPTAPASLKPRSNPPPGFAPDRELRGRQPGTCGIEPPDVRAATQQVTRRQEQLVRVGLAMKRSRTCSIVSRRHERGSFTSRRRRKTEQRSQRGLRAEPARSRQSV